MYDKKGFDEMIPKLGKGEFGVDYQKMRRYNSEKRTGVK